MTFQIHPQLEQDSIELGHFKLSQLLLINDSHYPWFVLVPQRSNITEIYQLSVDDQQLLIQESSLLAETLVHSFNGDKMNIASIGNIVPQLHIHHIVRYTSDISWPAPVWGKFSAISYTKVQLDKIKLLINHDLKGSFKPSHI